MKKNLSLSLTGAITFMYSVSAFSTGINPPVNSTGKSNQISFTENRGQILDQNRKANNSVLFSGKANELNFHLKKNGISYQLEKINSTIKSNNRTIANSVSIHRLDINWLNSNSNYNILKNNELPGFINYYNLESPITNVKSYSEVTYQNLYHNIDLKWYENSGELEYDFIVNPGADYKQIKMQIKGAKKLNINNAGELEMETPFGKVVEKAPYVVEEGKVLKSKWKLHGNIVSFEVSGHDMTKTMIIDPAVRVWGTYYGGTGNDAIWNMTADDMGNLYVSGQSNSATGTIIATSGAYQTTNGGSHDAFLAKFDLNGVRQWATYYGGAGNDVGYDCLIDNSTGDVYMGGTSSTTGTIMATSGAHQVSHGGGTNDGFITKFNSAGSLQWATYYGGSTEDQIRGLAIDASGDIYASGFTSSSGGTVIASSGAHQTANAGGANDAFLVKFDPNGVRQWGTYYGGTAEDRGFSCDVDPSGNVFLFGDAASNVGTAIATTGSHQDVQGGGFDGFIAKFNSSGVRQWGTYYGGTSHEYEEVGKVDADGNVYLNGYTASANNIGTAGTYAPNFIGGTNDAFLAKFDNNGVRQWGTYHGSNNSTDFVGKSFDVDPNGNIYFGGFTQGGTNGYATTGAYQTAYTAGDEGYLVAFLPNGQKAWGTYYGGAGGDIVWAVRYFNGMLFISGQTTTSGGTTIATTGSHQDTYSGGGVDGFLVRFDPKRAETLNFDNANDMVNTGTGIGTALVGTNKITVEAWVRPTSGSGLDCIAGNYSTPSNQMQFLLRKENLTDYKFWIGNSSSASYTSVTSAAIPTLNVWQHVAGVFDGTVASIYINGVLSATNAINLSAFVANTNSVVIGGNGINENFSGNIDELRIWNRALCQGEIIHNMNAEIASSANGLMANYHFNQGFDGEINTGIDTLYDYSGNNNYGTLTNFALSGATSNWIAPGAVTSDSSVVAYTNPVISVNSGTICTGNSFTMNPSGAASYTFEGGNAVVSPTATSNYSVVGTTSLGCITDAVTSSLTVNPLPTVNAVTNSTLICSGQSSTLTASGATTYTWNTTSNLVSIVVSPTVTTNYTVTGEDANNCTNMAVVTQSVSDCTGLSLNSNQTSGISIYPNPFNDQLIIEMNSENTDVIICNTLGAIVYSGKIEQNKAVINLSQLKSGIYFVKINQQVMKVIKE